MTDTKKSAPAADDSRETSAPAWVSEELNRVYGRLGNVVDLLESHGSLLDNHGTLLNELVSDSRKARPLLERYLGSKWAQIGGGKRGRG